MVTFNFLQEISNNNYSKLRSIQELHAPPVVPHLSIYLTDLTFIHEMSFRNERDMLNFKRIKLTSESINNILKHQNKHTRFIKTQLIIDFLENLPALEEKKAYKLSLIVEKKEEN